MPKIKLDNCIRCMKCVRDCPSGAIDIDKGTISGTCIHCGHCVAICPESTIFPDEGDIRQLASNGLSPADFQNMSASVRSCRSYLDRVVDNEILQKLVENMKNYPSASNARPVEITVIRTRETIGRLNDLTANKLIRTLKLITSPVAAPFVGLFAPNTDLKGLARYRDLFIERQVAGSSQVCYHAPMVMIFHAPVSRYGMASADSYIWATYTSLYANSLGLGSCFNGFIVKALERSRMMRKEFGIPAGHMAYAALLLGHPKVKYLNETSRRRPEARII